LTTLFIAPISWFLHDQRELDARLDAYSKWLKEKTTSLFLRNPELESQLARQLVPFIRDLLNSHASNGDDDVQREVARHVTSVLIHWPEALQHAVFADPQTRPRLAAVPKRWVSVGSDRILAADFIGAVALAFSEGEATVNLEPGRRPARIRVEKKAEAPPDIWLEAGERIHISDPLLLCASPLLEHRAEMLLAQPTYWEARFDSAADTEASLRGHADPLARVDLLQSWRESNPATRYTRITQLLQQYGSISIDELQPLGVRAQLRYLGLPEEFDVDAKNIDLAAQRLLEVVGFVEAVRRHAALPRNLPPKLLDGFAALVPSERIALLEELLDSKSPMHRVHGMQLAFAAALPGVTDAMGSWIRGGLQATRMLLNGYWWTIAAFAKFDPFSADAVRLGSWSHVGSLLHALPSGADDFVEVLCQNRKEDRLRAHLCMRVPISDVLDHGCITNIRLFAATLASCSQAFGSNALDAEAVASIRHQLSVDGGATIVPHPELLPHVVATDTLNSWFALPLSDLATVLNWPAISNYGPELSISIRAQALSVLAAAPHDAESWPLVVNVAPPRDWGIESAANLFQSAATANVSLLRSRCTPNLWNAIVALLTTNAATAAQRDIATRFLTLCFEPSPTQDYGWIDSLISLHAQDDVHTALTGVAGDLTKWLQTAPTAIVSIRNVLDVLESSVSVREAGPLRELRLRVGYG
jgi:hypothetical protein